MDTRSQVRSGLALLFAAIALHGMAFADDGIMYYHGDPKLLKGDGQIRMVREFVRIKVGAKTAKVYCRFVFRNEGRPTIARIGFPDGCDHDQEEGGDPVTPSLKGFRSCVDGKPTKINLERTKESSHVEYSFFHEKQVKFARHQTRVVEDWYESQLDEGGTSTVKDNTSNYYVYGLQYIMASGGSWKGKIGYARVDVKFEGHNFAHVHPVPVSEIGMPNDFPHWNRVPKNFVYWRGFARPSHVGNRLSFRRSHFKPTEDSDIDLTFGARIPKW